MPLNASLSREGEQCSLIKKLEQGMLLLGLRRRATFLPGTSFTPCRRAIRKNIYGRMLCILKKKNLRKRDNFVINYRILSVFEEVSNTL